MYLKFLLLLCLHYVCGTSFTPVVELAQGRVRGLRVLSGQKRYFGIPYASAKRFQPPGPARNWSEVFNAVLQFQSCAQSFGFVKEGIEDCLLLDVYSPENANRGDQLPVLVFIHGGAYFAGAKWIHDPEYLVAKNVIVVVINYRLGVFGFMCLNGVANLGLKDQTAALQWIRKNIAAFGGDPDNVTISGQSAGGTSVGMHIMSRRSKGLFHKAIIISGVPLTPWAFNVDPLTPAFEDASKLGPVRNTREVYDTFMKSSLSDILTATKGSIVNPKYFKYSPCGDSNNTDPFFHDSPYNIITSGEFNKVPTIIGVTNLEGFCFYGFNDKKSLENLDKNLPDKLPSQFSWCSKNDRKIIADQIRKHYFGKKKMSSKLSIKRGIDFYSDWMANGASDAFSKLLARYSDQPVYNYLFTYHGNLGYVKAAFNVGTDVKGESHGDDLNYMFKPVGVTDMLSDSDKLTIDRFTTMFTNFMKFGDPTPSPTALVPLLWEPTTASSALVLHIDRQLTLSPLPPDVRGEFFRSLLCTYGQQGYVPCESRMQCNLPNNNITAKIAKIKVYINK